MLHIFRGGLMKILNKWVVFAIVMGLLFVGSFITIMFSLDQSEEPIESDIIVVLQGSTNFERERVASALINEGYSESYQIIVSPLTTMDKSIYLERGLEESQIIDEDNATTTYTNATNTLKLLDEMGLKSAIILTSDYHTLRTKLIFTRVMDERNYDFKLTFVGANHRLLDQYGYDHGFGPWYMASNKVKKNAVTEYFKFIGYYFRAYTVDVWLNN